MRAVGFSQCGGEPHTEGHAAGLPNSIPVLPQTPAVGGGVPRIHGSLQEEGRYPIC